MNQAYILLDSTRRTPQIIQHQIIQSFAKKSNLNISFYGAEFLGLEMRHTQLSSYIENTKITNFIFYSLDQFYKEGIGFDVSIVEKAFERDRYFHFAVENRSILCYEDLKNLKFDTKICAINRINRARIDLTHKTMDK